MSFAPTRLLVCLRSLLLQIGTWVLIGTVGALGLFWRQSVILGQQVMSRWTRRTAARARSQLSFAARARWARFGSSAAAALVAALLAALVNVPFSPSPSLAAVPSSFEDSLVTQVPGPTALAFTPDGRMLITSHFGALRIYQNGALLPGPAVDISAKVCSDKERGLLGVAVDPAFTANHFIYLYYTFNKFGSCAYNSASSPVNRVVRFVLSDSNTASGEVVLVDNMPNPGGIHSAGDLHFGKDGYLYVSVGDGGCDLDDGTRCGSLNDNARQPHLLVGKVLRITRDGAIPPSNPFAATGDRCALNGGTAAGRPCQETFASGLRNPFRFAFDPNASSTRFFVNDTGQNTWEEVNQGQAGADYGWNVREGPCVRGSTTNCGAPPAGMTNPVYAYQHNSFVPPGSVNGCNAITGGAFVPSGVWPSEYTGSYLYGDFTCGTIFRITPAAGGGFTRTEFVTGLGDESAVVLAFGPHGATQALYYTTYNLGGQIRRVAYTGSGNRAPTASATANPPYGALPLTVAFDGGTSSDPDGDALTFEWNFGDGSPTASGRTVSHTYTTRAQFTATLTVRDSRGGSHTTTVRIDAGNTPPTPAITSPTTSKRFRVGEAITLQGTASDAEEGALPNTALSWVVLLHHDTHTHPYLAPTAGNDVVITAPAPEDLLAATNSYLEIQLTATDASGLTRTTSQNLLPNKVDVAFQTQPPGLSVVVNGTSVTGPTTLTSWEGYALDVNAPAQIDGSGQAYQFQSWSDGGAAAHRIITPATNATYSATFQPSTTLTLAPDADARVEETGPTANFGTSEYLRADGGSDPDIEAYLRFTVPDTGSRVTSAKLRLFVYNGSTNGPAIYTSGTGWTETGITWSNRPARTSGATDDKGAIADNTWVEFDVTVLVTGPGTYSLVMATSSADAVYTWSREAPANRPQLVLTLGTGSSTPTATPSPTRTPTAGVTATATASPTPTAIIPTSSLLFTPAADARVEQASASSNFGSATTLIADTSPAIHTYLRFAVTGVSAPVQRATLRLWVVDSTSNGPPVATCASTSWSETAITWANKPSVGTSRDDKGNLARGAWVEYDVTPFVTGTGGVCFTLVPQSSNGVDFSSKEGSNPPQLVIVQSGPISATPTPTSTVAPTMTPTPTWTSTPSATPTPGATRTPTTIPSPTSTPTRTATPVPTTTVTATPVPTATVPVGPIIATPVADARVEQGNPSANFGSAPTLITDNSPMTEAYLRFDIQGLAGPAQTATLRLWVVDPATNAPPISLCGTATWAESALTWNTRPAVTGSRDDKGAVNSGIWLEYDVTPWVTGNGPLCLALIPQSSNGLDLSSKEGSAPPQLVINGAPALTVSENPASAAPEINDSATNSAYPVVQTSRSKSTVAGTLAIDGNQATVWQTADGVDPGRVAVLTLDLGDPMAIDHVRFLTGPNGVAGSITIETSNDGEAWSYFGVPDSTAAGVWVNVARDSGLADPVTARFVRIVCVTTGADATLGGVAEVEVLPPPASQNPE